MTTQPTAAEVQAAAADLLAKIRETYPVLAAAGADTFAGWDDPLGDLHDVALPLADVAGEQLPEKPGDVLRLPE